MGDDSSIRRPSGATMRSITRSTCASEKNRPSVSSIFPSRSMYTPSSPLTITSLTVGSWRYRSIGP